MVAAAGPNIGRIARCVAARRNCACTGDPGENGRGHPVERPQPARPARVCPQPAGGRRVRDDPVRSGPTSAEQFRHDRLSCLEQAHLVGRVGAALVSHQETGPADDGRGPRIESLLDAGGVKHSAG
jgi:hypothetical protein